MWPFKKKDLKEKLLNLKNIKINGMAFTIKAISPLLDFPSDKMPQIFTDFVSARKVDPATVTVERVKKIQQDMYSTIAAGVVDPVIKPSGTKNELTPEDLFRDPSMGVKLYYAIMNHSLNKFSGLNHLFFSIGIKLSMLMFYASGTVKDLAHWSSKRTA